MLEIQHGHQLGSGPTFAIEVKSSSLYQPKRAHMDKIQINIALSNYG